MIRTADLGDLVQSHLKAALEALGIARSNPIVGIANAHSAIESARAVVRLLEAADNDLRTLNDVLNETKGTLSLLRDANIVQPTPQPPSPSTLATIDAAIADVTTSKESIRIQIEALGLTQIDLVGASGSSYRQARRRFLQALPVNDDDPFEAALLERCAKATRRLYVQLGVLLGGEHTKRSTKFGQLADLLEQHHRATIRGVSEGQQIEHLESEITSLGLEMFSRKPSAYREWLAGKLATDTDQTA